MRTLHNPHRDRTRPTHRPSPLNLPTQVLFRRPSHKSRSRSFFGMALHTRRRRRRATRFGRTRNHRFPFRDSSRRTRQTAQPGTRTGLLWTLKLPQRAERTRTRPIGREPHPLRTTPATLRHQGDNITLQPPRHLRSLTRGHHTRTRTLPRHQHHRTRTGIAHLTAHELRNPGTRGHPRRNRHPHRTRRQPHRTRHHATGRHRARRLRQHRRVRKHRRLRRTISHPNTVHLGQFGRVVVVCRRIGTGIHERGASVSRVSRARRTRRRLRSRTRLRAVGSRRQNTRVVTAGDRVMHRRCTGTWAPRRARSIRRRPIAPVLRYTSRSEAVTLRRIGTRSSGCDTTVSGQRAVAVPRSIVHTRRCDIGAAISGIRTVGRRRHASTGVTHPCRTVGTPGIAARKAGALRQAVRRRRRARSVVTP